MTTSHASLIQTRQFIRLAIAFIATFLFAGAAQAEPLSDDRIRSFIDSLEAAQTLVEENPEVEKDMMDDGGTPDMGRIFSSSLEQLEKHPQVRDQMKNIAKDHGFDNLDEWGETGDRVYAALIALSMEQESGHSASEMKQAMAEMENNPNMSDAQKAQMRQMMSGAMSAIETADKVPEEDKQAVRPYRDELEAMGEE